MWSQFMSWELWVFVRTLLAMLYNTNLSREENLLHKEKFKLRAAIKKAMKVFFSPFPACLLSKLVQCRKDFLVFIVEIWKKREVFSNVHNSLWFFFTFPSSFLVT